MKQIGGFLGRMTSRKFLLTVALCLIFVANMQYAEAVALAVAFITAEGAGDAVDRYVSGKGAAELAQTKLEQGIGDELPELTDVNKNSIQPGTAPVSGDLPM